MTKPKFSIVDDDKERRMCVLPEWDGTGNQYILDGSCTAEHALQLYRDYYAQPGHGAQEIIVGADPARFPGLRELRVV